VVLCLRGKGKENRKGNRKKGELFIGNGDREGQEERKGRKKEEEIEEFCVYKGKKGGRKKRGGGE